MLQHMLTAAAAAAAFAPGAFAVAAAPPPAAARAAALLAKLNVSEKLGLLSGIDGLGYSCDPGQPASSCKHPYVGNVQV